MLSSQFVTLAHPGSYVIFNVPPAHPSGSAMLAHTSTSVVWQYPGTLLSSGSSHTTFSAGCAEAVAVTATIANNATIPSNTIPFLFFIFFLFYLLFFYFIFDALTTIPLFDQTFLKTLMGRSPCISDLLNRGFLLPLSHLLSFSPSSIRFKK